METFYIIVSVLAAAIATAGAILGSRKLSGGPTKEQLVSLKEDAERLGESLSHVAEVKGGYFSRAQLAALTAQTEQFVEALDSQKQMIRDLEGRLEQAQKDVETKETEQQEMKSAKEDEESRLAEISTAFETYSAQSLSLEQELASSLKNLDAMIAEVPMTDDQKAIFQELSEVLTAASGRLRDLYIDYQAVNERLEALKQQHRDLEDEYTKLVEQQLGM